MIPKCANCGQTINANYAKDSEWLRYFELHLQACALAVQCRIDESLDTIATRLTDLAEHGLLMRMEGRVPTSAPERFQNGGE